MPRDRLACEQIRPSLTAFVEGRGSPEVEAHVAGCEACQELLVEAALRRPPAVTIPAGFAFRVMESAPAEVPPPRSILPYATAAAGLVSIVLAAITPPLPLAAAARWVWPLLAAMGDSRFLLGLLAAEGMLCLLWVWRAARA
jgi:hypothetical protein